MDMFTFSDKFNEYVNESKQAGIKILLPSVNESEMSFKSIDDKEILYGLSHIKGLNTLTSKQIIQETKNQKFKDFFDFIFRMSKYKIALNQYFVLIDSGALDEFGLNRATCKYNVEKLLKYADMFGYIKDGQMNFEIIKEDINKLELEKSVLGYYVSGFPLEKIRRMLERDGMVSLKDINNFDNKIVRMALLVKANKIIKTKKNELMSISSMIDEFSSISVVIFPKLYSQISSQLNVGGYLVVEGKVEIKDSVSIIANSIKALKIKE